jgi:hypothetical protein
MDIRGVHRGEEEEEEEEEMFLTPFIRFVRGQSSINERKVVNQKRTEGSLIGIERRWMREEVFDWIKH